MNRVEEIFAENMDLQWGGGFCRFMNDKPDCIFLEFTGTELKIDRARELAIWILKMTDEVVEDE